MKTIFDKKLHIEDLTIFIKIFKLYKSFLTLISDQKELGIGDVTLSIPPTIEGLKSTSSSFKLFGMHKNLMSSIIAKKISYILKAPILVLLFLKTEKEEEEILKPLINFLNMNLKEIIKK